MLKPAWTIGVVATALAVLLVVWWVFPNIRNDDKGYTAFGALLSALGFIGLIGTLLLQQHALRSSNAAHDEAMKAQREALRLSAASAVASSIASAVEHIEPELERVRRLLDDRRERARNDSEATIEALAKQLDHAEVLPSGMNASEVRDILILAATQGADAADEIKQLLQQEGELTQIKLQLLHQLQGSAVVAAIVYEDQIKAGLAEGDERLADVQRIFSQIYRLG